MLGGLFSAAMIRAAVDRRSAPITPAATAWLFTAGVSSLVAYGGMFYAFARSDLTIAVPFVSCWSLVAGLSAWWCSANARAPCT